MVAGPMLRLEPPGHVLHGWNGQGLVTHQVFSAPTEGPCPCFDTGGPLLL